MPGYFPAAGTTIGKAPTHTWCTYSYTYACILMEQAPIGMSAYPTLCSVPITYKCFCCECNVVLPVWIYRKGVPRPRKGIYYRRFVSYRLGLLSLIIQVVSSGSVSCYRILVIIVRCFVLLIHPVQVLFMERCPPYKHTTCYVYTSGRLRKCGSPGIPGLTTAKRVYLQFRYGNVRHTVT